MYDSDEEVEPEGQLMDRTRIKHLAASLGRDLVNAAAPPPRRSSRIPPAASAAPPLPPLPPPPPAGRFR